MRTYITTLTITVETVDPEGFPGSEVQGGVIGALAGSDAVAEAIRVCLSARSARVRVAQRHGTFGVTTPAAAS